MNGNLNFWLLKMSRVSAYFLLVFSILYLVSGFSMAGLYGANKIFNKNISKFIHLNLHIPFIIFLILHCSIDIYFALKRLRKSKK
jgi:hypothetical protein